MGVYIASCIFKWLGAHIVVLAESGVWGESKTHCVVSMKLR